MTEQATAVPQATAMSSRAQPDTRQVNVQAQTAATSPRRVQEAVAADAVERQLFQACATSALGVEESMLLLEERVTLSASPPPLPPVPRASFA